MAFFCLEPFNSLGVMPAEAGIQYTVSLLKIAEVTAIPLVTSACVYWVPASAGTTDTERMHKRATPF